MSAERLPIAAIAGLGLTQNIGYGTLYYSFSILAPSMARDFAVSNEWIFGALSVALLAGGFLAPWLGKWIDRYGAGRMMTIGSILAAVSLILCSFSPNALAFAGALTIIEIAANLVQYGAAFALLVQLAPNDAQRSITYLTLIAGFASTIFWPITTTLQHWLTWQQTYLLFACLHLFLCVPVHLMLARSIAKSGRKRSTHGTVATASSGDLPAHQRRNGFVLVLVAFSLQALVAAAILVHMVPMLGALGLAGSAAFIGAIFGPSQVASRLINMLGGKNLAPICLAIISASLMGLALIVLLFGAPSIVATMMFACLFGFGNGLFSIVSGTLPLSLFGSDGYGAMQGKIMSARLIISATAPFAMALGLETFGVKANLAVMVGTSLLSVIILFCITRLRENSISRD
ncbi:MULTISPECIES: arsenite efflux MFS transporter ArsK [Brucella/Ochrobactrum group]|uniref:Arsenite efflux MFS transporter ArsK n=2 Tax=Brucella anthropi TaxID=529 RepID=A0A6L3YYU1_BRUAN|nr:MULTISPECIES: arsenite efflux MFS transporter ArsK [Brucella/Ochrobactrum group]KAB2761346.1 arsenite efflux MFS transporter ArsK [Brucella anthropi]